MQSSLSIFDQNFLCKCEDTFFILKNKYLPFCEDSFGAKILWDDCTLRMWYCDNGSAWPNPSGNSFFRSPNVNLDLDESKRGI